MRAETAKRLYEYLETSDGQKHIYRTAVASERAGKDVCQIGTVKSATGKVLTKEDDNKEKWSQYLNWLMNEGNPRVETELRVVKYLGYFVEEKGGM